MPIKGDFFEWNEKNVNDVPEDAGVYAFYDKDDDLIYIGETSNLRERFQSYWNNNFENDPCKRDTVRYKREFTDKHEEREEELLEEYKRQHGRLPRCNDIIA